MNSDDDLKDQVTKTKTTMSNENIATATTTTTTKLNPMADEKEKEKANKLITINTNMHAVKDLAVKQETNIVIHENQIMEFNNGFFQIFYMYDFCFLIFIFFFCSSILCENQKWRDVYSC
jgi:hypothetical protein